MIRFMAVLVPVVFLASGLTKGNWMQSLLFALSVAVGLTPELLPMFAYLFLCMLLYMALATCLKKAYVRYYGELL